jgi:hypothetical protein
MNRRHLVASLFVAVLIAAAGYPALSSWTAAVAPPPAPIADLQAPAAEDGICPADGFPAAPEAEEAACSRCPDGTPQCWGDKQCDPYCGGKGKGVCERINSCYKCCLCAVTS